MPSLHGYIAICDSRIAGVSEESATAAIEDALATEAISFTDVADGQVTTYSFVGVATLVVEHTNDVQPPQVPKKRRT